MKPCTHSFFLRPNGQFTCTHCGFALVVESGQGGVPFYKRLGSADGADPTRKRMRSVPQNFKLAYTCAWFDARRENEQPISPAQSIGRWDTDTKQTN